MITPDVGPGVQSGIQFYTLRDLDESLPDLIVRIGEAGYDGAEFGLGDTDPEDARRVLDAAGVEAVAVGAGPEAIDDDPERVAADAEAVGAEYVMLGYLPPERFDSAEQTRATAADLTAMATDLQAEGLQLLYHNHDHEFRTVGGRPAFEVLLEAAGPELAFELDLGWVGTGGGNPYELLADLGERAPVIHLKDMAFEAGEFRELGEGDLDLERAIETARAAGVEWVVYEHDEPEDPAASLAHAADLLERLL
jgi:sugar phosphate isomerase/epimerase